MAKSFKNLPRPGESALPHKPASERDFFDLSDEPAVAAKPRQNKGDNTSNINNTSNITDVNKPAARENVAARLVAVEAPSVEEKGINSDVRQTFVLSSAHLEQLRDYVHARRAQGDYLYSQKQALQEALDLLFASAAPAPPRPAQTREVEQQRRQRIQQGRRSTNKKD